MVKNCSVLCGVLLVALTLGVAQTNTGSEQQPSPERRDSCLNNPAQCRQIRVQDPSSEGKESSPENGPLAAGSTPVPHTSRGSLDLPPRTGLDDIYPTDLPTEFQQFVEGSAGYPIALFGHELFRQVPSTFAPLDKVPVPSNYVIGPGDELIIRTWGQLDLDARLVVDRSGQVYLPKVGPITVAGVPYDQLPGRIEQSVRQIFRNFEISVSLGRLRSIQVFVVGYARRPGTYTISSLSTVVNALFASGGPGPNGSMRYIQVRRGEQTIGEFDLYDLLLKGDKSKDIPLLSGDVIHIPAAGPQVAIVGSVRFPAVYELHGSTSLAQGLDLAGGLSTIADSERVTIERIEEHTTRKVEQFRLDQDGALAELRDGDLVRVFSISPKFANTVTLRGNVAQPGRYPFRSGMRIRDLIPNSEFLLTREFWHNQNGRRRADKPGEEWVREGGEFESPEPVKPYPDAAPSDTPVPDRQPSETSSPDPQNHAAGESGYQRTTNSLVRNPAELRNDVKRNAPDINWDYAVVQRLEPRDLSTVLIQFNLGKAVLEGSDTDNIALQPGDVVTIFSQRDIEVPNEHRSKFIRLEGEFRSPGVYKVGPDETLQSVIARAGGLTGKAFVFGAQLTRETAQKQQQASLDRMVQDLEMEARQQSFYLATARSDQQQNMQSQMESQRLLIQRLREIKATGRVVLNIKPGQADISAFPDIPLEDGDRLLVTHRPSTISVVGSVYNQSSFLFDENTRVFDYLKAAGGGTRDADLKHTFIIRANGSVISKQNTSGLWSGGLEHVRALPGDTLVVPARLDKGSAMRAFKDWSQILGQIGLAAAAINVLR